MNSKDELTKWAKELVANSTLEQGQKKVALSIATKVISQGGWRGNVSDALKARNFTNEDFNFELYV